MTCSICSGGGTRPINWPVSRSMTSVPPRPRFGAAWTPAWSHTLPAKLSWSASRRHGCRVLGAWPVASWVADRTLAPAVRVVNTGPMRTIWKGAITFGLVHVPVKVYSATQSHDVSLHQVHGEDGGRIRYQRKCEVCDEVVPYDAIEKAYDDGDQT